MSINKIAAERNQRALMELVSQPGNDLCADCKNRNPRWASYNLGIFLCVGCASIHRKMGTHISKVKSLTMDTWTKEQVEFMRSMGNSKSNAHYNPDETKHPPPTNMIESERDSDLEKYIRSKYQYKSFVTRSAQVAALLGPSRSASDRLSPVPPRSATMPPSASSSSSVSRPAPAPAFPTSSSSTPSAAVANQSQPRSVSQPVAPPHPAPQPIQMPQQLPPQSTTSPPQQSHQLSNPVWNDLAQLQAPATNSSLPLQFASSPATQAINVPHPSSLSVPNQFSGLSVSPNNHFPSSLTQQPTGAFPGGTPRSMSLHTGLSNMSLSGMNSTLGVPGTSPSMFQPQSTMGGGLSAPSTFLSQNTIPSPFAAPSSLPSTNLGISQPSFAPSSFSQPSQPLYTPQPQAHPQASPMFQPQPLGQMQGSPMFQSSPLGQAPTGNLNRNPYGLSPMQASPQPGITPFSSPQPQFGGSPSPAPFMQQPQFAQSNAGLGMGGMPGNAFGGTGWGQPTGFPGQQPRGM
ncbi:hypothetical protein BD309DRAFT_898185 [Dichomitus squalens]|uniref:Uncharacterized protein n=1 Tax=Dichomitus squalens TaxID=114155 RepID=A0A4Q9NJD0_9APHY|nr:hypothetical protein BD309DRAFT_898185 [Dichomitus squalens]TBU59764.1 hypothetical protein BD310DRAFT_368847 [Dichomitus squalens]